MWQGLLVEHFVSSRRLGSMHKVSGVKGVSSCAGLARLLGRDELAHLPTTYMPVAPLGG
jgi:hypothetical protein